MFFNFVERYQVTLSHKFCEMFHQVTPQHQSFIRETNLFDDGGKIGYLIFLIRGSLFNLSWKYLLLPEWFPRL